MARADPEPPPKANPALVLSFAATTLIWGSTWLLIKTQLGVVPPSWSVTYRFLIGSAVLLLWCLAMRRPFRLGWRGHGFALLTGFLQFALNFNFVYRAELTLTSGLVALVYTLLVISNAVLAAVFLKQRVSAQFVAGSTMGIAGVAMLVGRDVAGAPGNLTGLMFAIGGVLVASLSNVLQAGGLARRLPAEATLMTAMFYGAALDAGFALATAGPPVFDPHPAYWLGLAYLAVFASAGTFLIYYAMIRRIGAATAGYVNVLVPVIAMSLSTVFEGYRWTWLGGAGVALALAGLVVVLRSRR